MKYLAALALIVVGYAACQTDWHPWSLIPLVPPYAYVGWRMFLHTSSACVRDGSQTEPMGFDYLVGMVAGVAWPVILPAFAAMWHGVFPAAAWFARSIERCVMNYSKNNVDKKS